MDSNMDKRLNILIWYFDTTRMHTCIVDIPACNWGITQEVFDKLDGVLRYWVITEIPKV